MAAILRTALYRTTTSPSVFLRCSATTTVHARSFSAAARRQIEAGRSHQASTALQADVHHREEGSKVGVVGEEMKGSEGPHYQDKAISDTLSSHDQHGSWTLMQPIYTKEEVDCVQVVGRTPVTTSDKIAHGLVNVLRKTFDFFARYKHYDVPADILAMKPIPIEKLRAEGKILTVNQWMTRVILLESFAGCPGMVAGTLRHLRSLRLLRRDGGWIHTMLEEAENERMHLLTFLTVAQPTWLTRVMVMAAQGVMYNILFFSYLVSPRTVHRFVGALEEEATRTYTHCISDLEKGLIPEWVDVPAPKIAIDYWRMGPESTLLDVIKAVRADEATHRFVNHSLANLDQARDFNPFALGEPSAELRGTTAEFTRAQSADFARRAQQQVVEQQQQARIEHAGQ
ncbi:alternative oxidase 1 [Dioszegia hungarica]|uniref:Alternative oxidase n=1 Tax=Dioszegia hungarica TaxID=4972 RepID=A0AA38LXK5_9TREE|nr:alternative oxidase 1 [Dioszegia hungarica]KAI9639822.1 alternative oxidase 1 [Dioszegia hungarica]